MATQPTNNAVPSESPRDLKFNAGKIDQFVTSDEHEYVDRFGGRHRTIEGINYDANQAILNYGYITKDSFEDGSTLSIANECLRWKSNGEYYRWDGAFPKVVPPGSAPDSAGGIGKGKWVGVGDASLRSQLASSSDGAGDQMIAVKYPSANSVATTQHSVNMRTVNIMDFGGIPDGVTATEVALAKIKNDLGSNVCVIFPWVVGQSVYHFTNKFDPQSLSGFTFDVDPGVTLDLPDIAFIDRSIVFTRDTKAVFWAIGNCPFTFPATNKKYGQSRAIWHIEPDVSETYPINPSLIGSAADLEFVQFDQSLDTETAIVPAAVSVNGVAFTNSNNSIGQYALASIGAGEEITAIFSATSGATATYSGMVVTSNSRYWFTCGVTNTDYLFTWSKVLGSSVSGGKLYYEGQDTHDSYRLASSNVTLRKDSATHFSLLINGYAVWDTETSGPIVRMGHGAVGGSGTITVSDLVHRRNTPIDKGKFIGVSVFGDSISDKANYSSWPEVMQSILDANNGVRVANVFNYAVSGSTSSAQLPFVTATNLGNSNFALILLGTNDIQAGVAVSTYKSNLQSIINTCRNNGNIPIIGIPPMFYSKVKTQPPRGQDTKNYSLGAPYRQAALRLCAEMACKVVDLGPVLGPVLGNWANIDLGIPYGDGTFFDNIHPTANGRYLIARAFAAALLGVIVTDRDDSYDGQLSTASLQPNWIMSSDPVGYSKDEAGRVFLSGSFQQTTGISIPDGTAIYVLPKDTRPKNDTWFPVANEFTSCRILISSDGVIRVFGMTGGLILSMDGVVIKTRKRIGDK